jgi:acyl-CoA hydrolase
MKREKYSPIKITLLSAIAFILSATMTLTLFLGNQTIAQSADTDLKIIAFGDSLTRGVGTDKTYHEYLEEWTGTDIENAGVTGDTTEEALERLDQDVLSKNPDIVFVFLGGNDFIQNVDDDETFENLVEITEEIVDSGATPILMALHGRLFLRSQERIYRAVQDEVDGVEYVPQVFSGILGRSFYFDDITEDQVHPNENGHELIAERTFPVFQEVLNDEDPNADVFTHCRIDYPDETDPFDNNEVDIDDRVTWRGYAWGGGDDDYDYEWEYEDEIVSRDDEVSARGFRSTGTIELTFSAEVDGESDSDRCDDIEVVGPPADAIAGYCAVKVDPTSRRVYYGVQGFGGNGRFEYTWTTEGDDGRTYSTDEFQNVYFQYNEPGFKEATVTIESGDEEIDLTCGGELLDISEEEQGFFNSRSTRYRYGTSQSTGVLGGSCEPRIRYDSRYASYTADVTGVPRRSDVTITWDVDGKQIESSRIAGTYDDDGKKSVDVTIESDDSEVDLQCEIVLVD